MSAESAHVEQPKLRYAWLWWTTGWVLVMLTVRQSLASATDLPDFHYNDKVVHFSGYFLLATWFGGVARRARYLIVGAMLIALGGAIEIAQGLMGHGRDAELLDFLANSAGVTLALLVAYAGLGMWPVWVERLFRLQR